MLTQTPEIADRFIHNGDLHCDHIYCNVVTQLAALETGEFRRIQFVPCRWIWTKVVAHISSVFCTVHTQRRRSWGGERGGPGPSNICSGWALILQGTIKWMNTVVYLVGYLLLLAVRGKLTYQQMTTQHAPNNIILNDTLKNIGKPTQAPPTHYPF